ncbi:MAG TPA: formate dehydrogenase subunit gamma [Xanthobacteraceae bacterium]|nr:formate dehydrogenase subunit gamma [Xanthobacteraceae bacterium]
MAPLFRSLRYLVGAFALLGMLLVATPGGAQQPTSVNPTASSVKEQQLLNQLKQIQGRISIPDARESMLEHPQGREWRAFHEVTLRWIGAIAILGMLAIIVVFYLWRGMIRIESGRSGRKIVRFNAFERFVHWMTATCFILQALTGLNITFGKPLLMPLMSAEAFSAWSQWAKYVHNYLSFPFTLGVILIFFMWIGGNIPNKVDVEWIKRGGGLVGHDHPPAYRFNAGQKAIYWIQVLGGTAVAISGYVLMFPFYGTNINNMELAEITHGTIAMLFIAIMIAHVYIGTIGMEGAFEGMGEGTVDLNWAREHHQLWVEEENALDKRASAAGHLTAAE